MNLFKSMDLYCERIDPSFWAEPLNAISNLGFIIVGIYWLYQNKTLKNNWIQTFAILTVVVGVGSFLFHTFANFWSFLCDVIPIMILMCTFFYYSFRYVLKLSWQRSALGIIAFMGLGILLEMIKLPALNGSDAYLHAFVLMISLALILKKINPYQSKIYLRAAALFAISLTFRTIDNGLCSSLDIGTHYFWHALNALVIHILIQIPKSVSS